jgi:hypothetical protein
MDIANVVATYLADNGFGVLGTSIFVGYLPENTAGIYIDRIGGQLNNYVPIEESVLNIYVKNTSGSQAVGTLESIKNFIHRMHSTEKGGAYIYTFLVLGDIEDVARDLEYGKIYKMSLQVTFTNTGIIS